MYKIYKSKLVPVLISFFRSAPVLVLASLACRFLFLALQIISIGIIFSWVSGGINSHLLSWVGSPAESYVYPCLGAVGFVGATVFSLVSKILALKSTLRFEKKVVQINERLRLPLTKSDLKNIVKLLVSVVDVSVPLGLVVVVGLVWAFITPYSILVVFILAALGGWVSKKGVIFSARKYKALHSKGKLDEYLGGGEHLSFYRILLLPSYISLVAIVIVSVSIVLSMIATKIYFSSHGLSIGHTAILTGVAFLQAKSMTSIILRAGAYNKSLSAIYNVISSRSVAK